MRHNRHPGDQPIPRRLVVQPGWATTVYRLGKAAGQAEAGRYGGLDRTEYWQVYADVMNDLGGLGDDQ